MDATPHASYKANWHGVVAAAIVIGAEFEGIKNETAAQLAAHTWVFWLVLVCAIVAGFGNSAIGTRSASVPAAIPSPDEKQNPKSPLAPLPPGSA